MLVARQLKHPDATLERAEARPTTSTSPTAPLVLPPKPRDRQRLYRSRIITTPDRKLVHHPTS